MVGLDGIGRRIATLLAADGVGALLLVDHRTVTRRTQRQDGYDHDDVGRLKAHAAAQACHETNPTREVVTHTGQSEPDISGVDAVIVCRERRRRNRQAGPITLVHLIQTGSGGGQARIECVPASQPGPLAMSAPALASIIAGLAVEEAWRLLAADPRPRRTRRINLAGMTVRISTRP